VFQDAQVIGGRPTVRLATSVVSDDKVEDLKGLQRCIIVVNSADKMVIGTVALLHRIPRRYLSAMDDAGARVLPWHQVIKRHG
jgi:hypothetical protein